MHSKNIPIKSVLICDKCGSTDITYSKDDEKIVTNLVTMTEWATGKFEDFKNFDYIETIQCNECKYEQHRRRKKR